MGIAVLNYISKSSANKRIPQTAKRKVSSESTRSEKLLHVVLYWIIFRADSEPPLWDIETNIRRPLLLQTPSGCCLQSCCRTWNRRNLSTTEILTSACSTLGIVSLSERVSSNLTGAAPNLTATVSTRRLWSYLWDWIGVSILSKCWRLAAHS